MPACLVGRQLRVKAAKVVSHIPRHPGFFSVWDPRGDHSFIPSGYSHCRMG